MATAISIDEAVKACALAGNGMIPGKSPIKSALKAETSLVGLAYLNYIYQNDIANAHFCEAMLLMHAQVPGGRANPYVALFTLKNAAATMAALADVQLIFDYAIARSDPPEAKGRGFARYLAGDRRLRLTGTKSALARNFWESYPQARSTPYGPVYQRHQNDGGSVPARSAGRLLRREANR
jgi:hypothetical protein